MCIFSGCDYLPSVPGIGLGKATKLMRKHRWNPVQVTTSSIAVTSQDVLIRSIHVLWNLESELISELISQPGSALGVLRFESLLFSHGSCICPLLQVMCPVTMRQTSRRQSTHSSTSWCSIPALRSKFTSMSFRTGLTQKSLNLLECILCCCCCYCCC